MTDRLPPRAWLALPWLWLSAACGTGQPAPPRLARAEPVPPRAEAPASAGAAPVASAALAFPGSMRADGTTDFSGGGMFGGGGIGRAPEMLEGGWMRVEGSGGMDALAPGQARLASISLDTGCGTIDGAAKFVIALPRDGGPRLRAAMRSEALALSR